MASCAICLPIHEVKELGRLWPLYPPLPPVPMPCVETRQGILVPLYNESFRKSTIHSFRYIDEFTLRMYSTVGPPNNGHT